MNPREKCVSEARKNRCKEEFTVIVRFVKVAEPLGDIRPFNRVGLLRFHGRKCGSFDRRFNYRPPIHYTLFAEGPRQENRSKSTRRVAGNDYLVPDTC